MVTNGLLKDGVSEILVVSCADDDAGADSFDGGFSLLHQQIVTFADLLRRAVWKVALLLGDEFLNAAT